MISTTWTASAALILTLLPGLDPSSLGADAPGLLASTRSRMHRPLRDDGLGHATLDALPDFEPEPEPDPEPSTDLDFVTDPYGFAAFLNSYRAAAGLPPVSYCPNLSAWASQNNAAQCSFGLGHHVLANFFQNSGFNQSTVAEIALSWMNSPAHAQNMLAPGVTRFGIAYGPGPYWTLNLQ
ncbi:CAP domain-containing protein [Tautonia sociabilis]|uniref:CAP domain-containing protein n=1 Tax=Tautonia sociabilis TaxID=2080755 RepID=A0A432MLE4_9BACT|nr:CAP domain-containing protein [Tautonia sociabilis]RUL87908.1 CAP domain-containing protein [Tautonia sociabilis]